MIKAFLNVNKKGLATVVLLSLFGIGFVASLKSNTFRWFIGAGAPKQMLLFAFGSGFGWCKTYGVVWLI